jgi:hypothetical protein
VNEIYKLGRALWGIWRTSETSTLTEEGEYILRRWGRGMMPSIMERRELIEM